MATASVGSVPFQEQLEFFRRKLNLPTQAWTDIYAEEHEWAFVVAGASRDEIVADFRVAVEKAIRDGTTLEEFRRDFDTIVARHGWEYNGGRNWRSRVIYDTNIRTSYSAGRWEQLQAIKHIRPWWQYLHSDAVQHPRPVHESWNGLILHCDNPWWLIYFPVNAWGCQCSVRALSDEDLARLGKSGPDPTPEIEYEERTIGQRSPGGPRTVRVPVGVDPGFEYAPGVRSRISSAMPGPGSAPPASGVPVRPPVDLLPPPRPAEALLPELDSEQALDRFLDRFGATRTSPQLHVDPVGERLPIGLEMFQPAGEAVPPLPVAPPELPLLAQALAEPDEIWTRIEWLEGLATAVVRRRYLARVRVPGQREPVLAVFERGRDGWTGRVVADAEAEAWRVGVRLYRREGG